MQKWKLEIEIEVTDGWVADGFDLSQRTEEIEESFRELLPHAEQSEIKLKIEVKKAPSAEKIRELQGFE